MILPFSPLILVGWVLLCLGEILHIIGVATTHWTDTELPDYDVYKGLFKICSNGHCVDYLKTSTELKAVRAMEILALLSGFSAIVLATFITFKKIKLRSAPMVVLILCMVASILSFVLINIGIVVYGVKIYKFFKDNETDITKVSIGYSFALPIVGGVFMAVGGILVFFGGKQPLGGEYNPLS